LRPAALRCALLPLAGSASGTGWACRALCRAAGLHAKAVYRLRQARGGGASAARASCARAQAEYVLMSANLRRPNPTPGAGR